jgi:hypothetical protein
MRKGGRRAGGIVVCKISNILIVIVNKEMFAQTLAIKINILKLVVKQFPLRLPVQPSQRP